METIDGGVYPDCPVVLRYVDVGGCTKQELLEKLETQGVLMNESANTLFKDARFKVSPTSYTLPTVELMVENLGLPQGSNLSGILGEAKRLGLEVCPLELAPFLRLSYMDQPEGFKDKPERLHQAPYGSITIASSPLTGDDEFPKGFYVRRIDGVLWLRGYRASNLHIWNPYDHIIFCKKAEQD